METTHSCHRNLPALVGVVVGLKVSKELPSIRILIQRRCRTNLNHIILLVYQDEINSKLIHQLIIFFIARSQWFFNMIAKIEFIIQIFFFNYTSHLLKIRKGITWLTYFDQKVNFQIFLCLILTFVFNNLTTKIIRLINQWLVTNYIPLVQLKSYCIDTCNRWNTKV